MAESFLFTIAESLATKLASDALERASQVVGVYDNLLELKNTLNLIKDVLLDAEQNKEKNHALQTWLKQLKTIFSDAEDMLDEFDCQTLRKKVVKDHGSTKDKVSYFFSSSNPLVFRYRMAQKIKDLTQRLDKVANDRNKFTLRTIEVDPRVVHTREMTHSSMTDLVFIGREHDKEKIIKLLIQQKPNGGDDKGFSVIPVVGMGGLGKTTLAKVVFNDNRIQECFPLKMWVCVSDEFDIKQLIIKIINSANNVPSADAPLPHQQFLNMLDIDQLQNQLKNKLADRKFLLVLDDVWNENRDKWIELRNLIKVCAAGSKVLVTTRYDSIGSMMGTVPSHILEGLSHKHSLSLLIKWAFRVEGEEENHTELVEIGEEIVKKCRGVPLAVKTLGSLLYTKLEVSDWEHVRDSEIWNLQQDKYDILPALKLSYDLLPSYLRQCFALFSLYPKDYDYFNSFEVTTLWGALGLLESPKKNCTLGEVANQYLNELLSRSFLQDFVQNGNVYGFRIHDLMHDLALMVAKDDCLLVNSILPDIPENVQHLSFLESKLFDNSLTKKSRAVKTILFPNGAEGAEGKALLKICLSKFKYLRVLDLCGSSLETLPCAIDRLKHLRYLDISQSHLIKRLPSSICKLQSLQVLKLDGCTELEELPKGLRKLINLRHFEFSTKQSLLPEDEIASLGLLVNLSIESSHYLESIFGGVKFPALRALNVTDCQSLKSLSLDGENFPKLETLFVEDCDNLDLELCKGYHKEESSKLKLKTVEFSTLSQLVVLPKWLQEVANSLQFLFISNCDNLETLPDWLTTFTRLKTLCITDCPKLVSLPDNIDHLSLASLRIEGCPDLCKKYEPDVGEFWPKISRIKDIVIDKPEEEEKN